MSGFLSSNTVRLIRFRRPAASEQHPIKEGTTHAYRLGVSKDELEAARDAIERKELGDSEALTSNGLLRSWISGRLLRALRKDQVGKGRRRGKAHRI